MIEKYNHKKSFFLSLGIVTSLTIVLAIFTELYFIALIPLVLLIGVLFVLNFKQFYFLLIASIPLCIEYDISGGFSTDIPTEPLCILLMIATVLYFIGNSKIKTLDFLRSPFIAMIGIVWLWSVLCVFSSQVPLVSFKFILSKIWYIITYLILTIMVVNNLSNLRKLFWCFFIPLFFTVVYAFIRHSLNGFSFELMNEPSLPFYRNHVMYAATITIFYPFIIYARTWYKPNTLIHYFLTFNILFFPIAIYFTYTRACILALVVGAVFYYIIKLKRVKESLIAVFIGVILFSSFLYYHNNYLKYAPEFTKTVYHDSYDNHIEATFEGNDASSMERINMWIGAIRMFPHYPIFGVGPGNFYPFYKSYTVIHYHTWVSDNELKLSCHNYFLLLLAEQGLPGALLFIILSCMIFIFIEKQYHLTNDPETKKLFLCLGAAFAMMYVNLTLSDMIETVKIGALFFIMIGLLINAKAKCFETD